MSNFEKHNPKWFVNSKGEEMPQIKTYRNVLGQPCATLINNLSGKRNPTNISLTVGEQSLVVSIAQGKQHLLGFVEKELLIALLEADKGD